MGTRRGIPTTLAQSLTISDTHDIVDEEAMDKKKDE